jgi:hypothetical protein
VPYVFLLSPARCSGRRALFLRRPGADFPEARLLRERTLTLGETFAFLSGLYFRGKLAYAQAFGCASLPVPASLIITPTRGLLPPDTLVDPEMLDEFASVDIAVDLPAYREPLARDVRHLASGLPAGAGAILLGSIATPKYTAPLVEALHGRLYYPIDFVGRGDMSRGGLMLRSVAGAAELAYAPLSGDACLRGRRPPRLTPLDQTDEGG